MKKNCVIAFSSLMLSCALYAQNKRMNVVFIMADDLGLDINRAALRLWLTLEESERLTGQAPPRWRDLWQALSAAPTAAPEHAQGDEGRALTLQLQALTARDLLAWLVLALALAASVFG
jgi:hypothetical protein